MTKRAYINDNGKETSGAGGDDDDGHDPTEVDPGDLLPVDRSEVAVTEGHTYSTSSDTHSGGHRDTELRGENDGDGRTHLHTETTRRGVEGDLVAQDGHDVVTVGSQTENESRSSVDQHPDGDIGILAGGGPVLPGVEDDGERTDSVGQIVGPVGEAVQRK